MPTQPGVKIQPLPMLKKNTRPAVIQIEFSIFNPLSYLNVAHVTSSQPNGYNRLLYAYIRLKLSAQGRIHRAQEYDPSLARFILELIDVKTHPVYNRSNKWYPGFVLSFLVFSALSQQQKLEMFSKQGSKQPIIFWETSLTHWWTLHWWTLHIFTRATIENQQRLHL